MMAKKKQQKKSRFKIKLMPDGKPERIVYFIFVGIVLVIAFILISRQIERIKYLTLDSRMQTLTTNLQAIDPNVKWEYEKRCIGYGEFNLQPSCNVSVSGTSELSSQQSLKIYFDRYRDEILSSNTAQMKMVDQNIDLKDGGLTVHGYSLGLEESVSGLKCKFGGSLKDGSNELKEGDVISNFPSRLSLKLTCGGSTRAYWYDRTDTTIGFEKKKDIF